MADSAHSPELVGSRIHRAAGSPCPPHLALPQAFDSEHLKSPAPGLSTSLYAYQSWRGSRGVWMNYGLFRGCRVHELGLRLES